MAERWIMDVLADLRAFAGANDMPDLAAHLDEATHIAALELANRPNRKVARGGPVFGPPNRAEHALETPPARG